MEFLKQQGDIGNHSEADNAIFQALKERFGPKQGRAVKDQIFKAKNKYCEEHDVGNDASEPVLLAEGISQVVEKYQPKKISTIVWKKISTPKLEDKKPRYMPPFKLNFVD
jgi:hypothetical protein